MNHNTGATNECPVYPGEYVLLPEIKSRLDRFKSGGKDTSVQLPVNMNEFPDCYRIEVAIPGAVREEILMDITDNVLSIVVFRKEIVGETVGKEVLQLHEFNDEPVERQILLPDDANAEFISAGFVNGILRLDIPKDYTQTRTNSNQVVVY